jgi:hypothetical protein
MILNDIILSPGKGRHNIRRSYRGKRKKACRTLLTAEFLAVNAGGDEYGRDFLNVRPLPPLSGKRKPRHKNQPPGLFRAPGDVGLFYIERQYSV